MLSARRICLGCVSYKIYHFKPNIKWKFCNNFRQKHEICNIFFGHTVHFHYTSHRSVYSEATFSFSGAASKSHQNGRKMCCAILFQDFAELLLLGKNCLHQQGNPRMGILNEGKNFIFQSPSFESETWIGTIKWYVSILFSFGKIIYIIRLLFFRL